MKKAQRRSRASRARRKHISKIVVLIDDERWRKDPVALRLIRRAVRLAMRHSSNPLLEGGSKAASRGSREDGFGEGMAAHRPSPKSSSRLRSPKISTLPQGEGGGTVTILLADDARLKSLNRDFRKKNKPTNVLSFPSALPGYLGDVAIAYRTVAREARAQGKLFAHHAAHLALHGVLHLLGYDHQAKREANAMESLEIELLARLGIASPYVLRPLTRAKKAA